MHIAKKRFANLPCPKSAIRGWLLVALAQSTTKSFEGNLKFLGRDGQAPA
jgi:hypothetical protein